MYLLDTNVISEMRKPRPHGAVVAWMRSQTSESLFVSAITLLELQQGAERTRRQDAAAAQRIDLWINQIAASFSVLPLDEVICRERARLLAGKSEDLFEDGLIAATARVHRLTVATRNLRDFAHFDVPTFNPFRYSS
jgi:predicted nucleic acid-binding protein